MEELSGESPTRIGNHDTPTVGARNEVGDAGDRIDERVGPYALLELIGEGGFGVVWLAERREPMVQRVALKIIKPGMDSKAVVTRFERERQALAVMDHPNVAKVLDGGMTSSGRPYFVMELVKGEPITEFCDLHRITIEERLRLIASVCDAVQHAHMKGIIHRDIKPGNILVSAVESGGSRELVAKVIDFGIAKAFSPDGERMTMFTEQGQFVGTPEYMSPEQTGISGVDIDTRTDVYSLGVTLYELLSGSLPFDSAELRSGGYVGMQKMICETEAERPSMRLQTVGDSARSSIGRMRRESPESLSRLLRRELEWIPLKAIRKGRDERYQSPGALADDVRKYLRGEALLAGPESRVYRARKFVRRYRGQVAAAIAVFIALSVGLATTLRERNRAIENEAEARRNGARAEANAQAEAASRRRAESVIEFVTSTLQSADPTQDGGEQDVTVLEAMRSAMQEIEEGRFRDDPAVELRLQSTIGTILESNGRAREADLMFQRALTSARTLYKGDHPEVMQMLANVGSAQRSLGNTEESLRLYEEAISMAGRMYSEADEQTIKLRNNLASVLQDAGKLEEAEKMFARVLEDWKRLHPGDHPDITVGMENLASVQKQLGKFDEAERLLINALEMQRRLRIGDHPDTARSMNNLALILRQVKRFDEAERMLIEVLAMTERLYPKGHPDVASALHSLASAKHSLGHLEESEALYRRALTMRQELLGSDHSSVASTLNNLAKVMLEDDRFDEAQACYNESLRIFRARYSGDHPLIATSLNNLASAKARAGDLLEAQRLFGQAVDMGARVLPADHPDLAKFRAGLKYCEEQLADHAPAQP